MRTTFLAAFAATSTAFVLAACGGDDNSTASNSANTSSTTTASTTTISGSAVKGPVANATVTVKKAATGETLVTTTTGTGGTYSVDVTFQGDVIVEVSGGTYTDEATNVATSLSTPLKVVLNANGGNVTGIVTPLTTMAYTYAFGTAGTGVNAAAFNTTANNLATQFQLTGVNLATTLPTVTGTSNAYGQALRGLSQYLRTQNVSLQSLINNAFTTQQQLTTFSTAYTSAYNTINPGKEITFSFNGSGFNIAGTGAGGGTGTCGVSANGTVTTQNITVPVNFNYCISGIAAGSCASGNSTLSQALAAQNTTAGVNLTYSYSASCAAGAIAINLQ